MFSNLAAPFPPEDIDWRVGSTNADKTKGMALGYIDARVVMDRLDAVVGPAGWGCRYYIAEGKTVCELSLKCGDEWITKSDGAGNSDFEAEKGALSDAFKRAAVRWGVGRYLYSLASPWVPIETRGKTSFITDEGKRTLERLLSRGQDAPTPKTEPKPNGTPPKQTPEGWTNAAITIVKACRTRRELDDWVMSQGAKLDALEEKAPKERQRLAKAIDERFSALTELAAG